MAISVYKTLPTLRGTLASVGPWAGYFARSGWRVYPYRLGAQIRNDLTNNTQIDTHGMGDIAANNYLMVCSRTAYGAGHLYIPQTSQITRCTTIGTADDEINVNPAMTVTAGDYLFNLGNDGASAPLSAPSYDGSPIGLYTDPAGNNSAGDYLVTGTNGEFSGYIDEGYPSVDLLIVDSSGVPRAMLAGFTPGASVGV